MKSNLRYISMDKSFFYDFLIYVKTFFLLTKWNFKKHSDDTLSSTHINIYIWNLLKSDLIIFWNLIDFNI